MSTISFGERLVFLVQEMGLSEQEVLSMALDAGVQELFRQRVSEKYMAGAISRQQAEEWLGPREVARLDCLMRQCACQDAEDFLDLVCGLS